MQNIRCLIWIAVVIAALFVIRDIARSLSQRRQASDNKPRTIESAPVQQYYTKTSPEAAPYWQAHHETGNLEEYSWWRIEGVPTGNLLVIPDPTGSGHGSVLLGEISSSNLPGGDSHRIYPALLLPECYKGGYSFYVYKNFRHSISHAPVG